MPAVRYDFVIEQGATFAAVFEWHQDTVDGPLVDTTNYVPTLDIKTSAGGDPLASLTVGTGRTGRDLLRSAGPR